MRQLYFSMFIWCGGRRRTGDRRKWRRKTFFYVTCERQAVRFKNSPGRVHKLNHQKGRWLLGRFFHAHSLNWIIIKRRSMAINRSDSILNCTAPSTVQQTLLPNTAPYRFLLLHHIKSACHAWKARPDAFELGKKREIFAPHGWACMQMLRQQNSVPTMKTTTDEAPPLFGLAGGEIIIQWAPKKSKAANLIKMHGTWTIESQ